MPKKKASEEYCIACECQLFLPKEKFGPVCAACYKKTRRTDKLTSAALAQSLVAVVPTICPHEGDHGRCKFSGGTARHFNIIVLDKNLEPKQITGPYTERVAEKIAMKLRKKTDRRGR